MFIFEICLIFFNIFVERNTTTCLSEGCFLFINYDDAINRLLRAPTDLLRLFRKCVIRQLLHEAQVAAESREHLLGQLLTHAHEQLIQRRVADVLTRQRAVTVAL